MEVEDVQDEQMVALTLNSLQVEENAGRAGEQVLQMFKLQVEPSGSDRAQVAVKGAKSDGLSGGNFKNGGNLGSYGHGSNGGNRRSFSHGTNGGNSHRRSGRGGRC